MFLDFSESECEMYMYHRIWAGGTRPIYIYLEMKVQTNSSKEIIKFHSPHFGSYPRIVNACRDR